MTAEEIEKQHKEYVEIIKEIEQILISQHTTFQIHNDRLMKLRKIYLAINELESHQMRILNDAPSEQLNLFDKKPES